jgi:2-oxoisovalerate dehydrogenase E2 component (dihydrolipoyl transacylase)
MTKVSPPDVRTFCLPDLGEGLTSAEVVEWKITVGDTVTVDQSVVAVETAKAVVDIPIPFAGTVRSLHSLAGSVIEVGDPLISVDPAPSGAVEEEPESGSVLVGYGTGAASRPQAATTQPQSAHESSPRLPLVISPVVRRLAADHHIDVTALVPSGPGEIVLRRDVEAAIALGASAAPVPIPPRGIRWSMADAVARSRREIPDVTVWVEADATSLFHARDTLRASADGTGPGILALLVRICAAGLTQFRLLNSRFDSATGDVVQHPQVNVGFAVQTDHGLLVPVIRNAQQATLGQVSTRIGELTQAARRGSLTPKDCAGGTFTLNNYGVFGVDGATPIINYPEAAMVSVGQCVDRPWVVNGQLAVRKTTHLSLTFDHRVCDGGTAAGFLRFLADHVENPRLFLNDL